MLLKELKKFSKENWWVYILFFITLWIVAYTWNWNIIEIFLLFLANFLGNLCIMSMQSNYTEKNNRLWAIFQVAGTVVFLSLWVYWLIFLDQKQYILWQIAYTLSAIKAFSYYNLKKDLRFINWLILSIANILFIYIYYSFFYNWDFSFLIQAVWFSFSSTWFVLLNDKKRYYTILIWTWLLTIWSLMITYNSYILWATDGIALWYFLLTWTVWVYYIKLLKKYL